MAQTVQLVGEGPDRGRQGSVLLAGGAGGDARLVVVSRFLQGEAPLVSQLDLADGLCAEGTVDLARGRVALLGGAVVLDAAAVADEIVAGGLAVAIVGGAELDNTVALVLGHALHRRHQVVKGPEDALWRGQQRRRGGIRHRDELSHGGERERRGPFVRGEMGIIRRADARRGTQEATRCSLRLESIAVTVKSSWWWCRVRAGCDACLYGLQECRAEREKPGCEDFSNPHCRQVRVSRFGVDPVRATRASKIRALAVSSAVRWVCTEYSVGARKRAARTGHCAATYTF